MKTQGFTLIELLAVIVILAIIALIATPIVLGIIDDTKESAQIRSAEMYLKGVANAVMKENLEQEGNFKPTECTITTEGNLDCDDKEGILEVEVDGEKPKNGTITFEEGKIKEVTLNYTNSTIVKNDEGNLVYSDEESGSGSEEETLAPGLYDAEGNMTISWEQLTSKEYKTIVDEDYGNVDMHEGAILNVDENGALSVFWDETDSGTDYLVGKLVISDEVSSLGGDYCYGLTYCDGLTEIVFPDSCTEISNMIFLPNLTTVNISSSVEHIEFEDCYILETINYRGTMEQWNNIRLDDDWNYGCPEITVHCTDGDIIIPAWTE